MSDIAPKNYVVYRAATPIVIDGHLNDGPWKAAPWTDLFVDIEGDAKPLPRFATRVMMLWDDSTSILPPTWKSRTSGAR